MKEKEQNKTKKSKIFLMFMILYVSIWMVAIAFASDWVWDKAMAYQSGYDAAKAASQPELFMEKLTAEIDADKLLEWLGESKTFSASNYTNSDEYLKYFESIIGEKKIEYVATDSTNVYDITADNRIIATVRIGSNNIFDDYNFSGWKLLTADVVPYMYDALGKTIITDKNDVVYINGKLLTEEYIVKEKTPAMGDYMTGITGDEYGSYVYKVDGFLVEPDILVVDKNGQTVENTSVESDLAEFVSDEPVMEEATRQRVSETFYAYFQHMNKLKTFDEIKAYLQQGTDTYNLIEDTQMSIEWVTPAKSIAVVEEVIDEYYEYGDSYFSCNVYINMLKEYGYTSKNEYFNATVLFKKVDGQWYWDTFILNN